MKNAEYELTGRYIYLYVYRSVLATYFREVFLLCGGALMVCSQRLRRTARNLYTLPTCRANDLRAFTEQQDHIVVCVLGC